MRNYLKKMREEKRLSQKAAAQRLGISQSYYSMIETGCRQGELSLLLAKKLSDLFSVTLDFLEEQERGRTGKPAS